MTVCIHVTEIATAWFSIKSTEVVCLTSELKYTLIVLYKQVVEASGVSSGVWFPKDSCLLSHGKLWMRRWGMDAGYED